MPSAATPRTFVAALGVVGATTLGPLNLVDAVAGEASVLRKADNDYVAESLGLAPAAVVAPGQPATTTTAPSDEEHLDKRARGVRCSR